jgi:hypothetical protein
MTANMKFIQRFAVETKDLRAEVYKMRQDVTDVVYVMKGRRLICGRILTVFGNEVMEL